MSMPDQPGQPDQRVDVLQAIIDHLPSGLTMFDAQLSMVACNRRLRELLQFPDSLFEPSLPSLYDLALFNAQRGEYGAGDPHLIAQDVCERAKKMVPHVFERERPNGTVLEVRGAPLPGGGFVSIYTDITDRKQAEKSAQRYATYLDAVINALPQGVTVINDDLVIELWNRSFESLLEMPPGVMRSGVTYQDIVRFNALRGEYGAVDPEEKVRETANLARQFLPHRITRRRNDGRSLEIEGRAMHSGDRVVGFVTTYTDISERIRSEEALKRANELITDAISFSPTYVWETDAKGCYSHLQGVEHILGFNAADWMGRTPSDCMQNEGTLGLSELSTRMREHAPVERLLLQTGNARGEIVWLSSSARPVFDASGLFMGYRGVDVDVTEATVARQELENLALHDPLTGLANRRQFNMRFAVESSRLTRSGAPLSLVMADVDHFKRVNDCFGHLAGDTCLKAVVAVMVERVRSIDLVARFGGEEFLILMPDTTAEEAVLLSEELRRALAATDIDIGAAEPLRLTASFGVATFAPGESILIDGALAQADQATYAAKRGGRNRVCVAIAG